MIRIWNEVVEDGVAFPHRKNVWMRNARSFSQRRLIRRSRRTGRTDRSWGLYILHPNNVGRCGHICNASYAVSHGNRGLHIGEKLVKDCVAQGKVHGFRVLQFNAVVAGNVHARHLYERVGFRQLGVIPGGFRLKMGSMRISVRIILNSLTPLISSEQDRKDTIKNSYITCKTGYQSNRRKDRSNIIYNGG